MPEMRVCCNCDSVYHYYSEGEDENDPDYCENCSRDFSKVMSYDETDDYEDFEEWE